MLVMKVQMRSSELRQWHVVTGRWTDGREIKKVGLLGVSPGLVVCLMTRMAILLVYSERKMIPSFPLKTFSGSIVTVICPEQFFHLYLLPDCSVNILWSYFAYLSTPPPCFPPIIPGWGFYSICSKLLHWMSRNLAVFQKNICLWKPPSAFLKH